MRLLVAILVCAPSLASAAPSVIGGTALTLDPSRSPESGQLTNWAAYAPGTWFVGGEIAIGSPQVKYAEFAVSYHALAGARVQLSPRISALADGGLGVSQQTDWEWDILGDGGMDFSTRTWTPSAALRGHLVADLGTIRTTHVGLALATDARSTLDDSAAVELGVGLGFVLTN